MRAYSARTSVDGVRARLGREERRDYANGAARIVDIDGLPAPVIRVDLYRGMHAARGRPADQERYFEALPLHLGGDMAHLVERGRDETGEADDVGAFGDRRLQDFLRRHHHAEIDDLVIVAGENDADNVLADVVHVALDGGEHDLAVRRRMRPPILLLLHVGQQMSDGLLHHPRRFHHLRQEHAAGAEQIADDVHAVHKRAFDHRERARRFKPRFFDVGGDEISDAVDQRMRQPPLHRPFAPREIGFLSSPCRGRGGVRRARAGVRPHRRGG